MPLCNLKIELEDREENGVTEKRVPADLMRTLLEFAEHRELCDQCFKGWHMKTGAYCQTGVVLFEEVTSHPSVTLEPA